MSSDDRKRTQPEIISRFNHRHVRLSLFKKEEKKNKKKKKRKFSKHDAKRFCRCVELFSSLLSLKPNGKKKKKKRVLLL